MDLESIKKGIIIGFAVAAPVGPIGVLVIQRSFGGALVGLSTGLGAAVADATYALLGALATTFVLRLLSAAWLLELVGGAALAWLAMRTFRQGAPALVTTAATPLGLARAFGETLLLTLANPATILSFAAIAATQGLAHSMHATVFASGVFIGSAAWWLLLSSGVRFGSRTLGPGHLRFLRIASSGVLAAYALLALTKALLRF